MSSLWFQLDLVGSLSASSIFGPYFMWNLVLIRSLFLSSEVPTSFSDSVMSNVVFTLSVGFGGQLIGYVTTGRALICFLPPAQRCSTQLLLTVDPSYSSLNVSPFSDSLEKVMVLRFRVGSVTVDLEAKIPGLKSFLLPIKWACFCISTSNGCRSCCRCLNWLLFPCFWPKFGLFCPWSWIPHLIPWHFILDSSCVCGMM